MKLIKFSGNRESLNIDQRNFLAKLIPTIQLIQIWSMDKADFENIKTEVGVLPSIVLIDILLASNWGNHPISREEYNKKYSNNLTLMESNAYWFGKKHKYDDKEYKAYKDWGAFCVDYTDYIAFSGLFDKLLRTKDQEGQLVQLALTKEDPKVYQARGETLIDFYSLGEFDY